MSWGKITNSTILFKDFFLHVSVMQENFGGPFWPFNGLAVKINYTPQNPPHQLRVSEKDEHQ